MARSLNTEALRPSTASELAAHPVINACGIYTDLGGSRLSPVVLRAMAEVNANFVRITDLLESTGRVLAGHLGAEAGRVTPGAAASIALMASAAMTGTDGDASERLPDTTGLRNEILLQHNHRYKYDRQISMTGARLVLVGGDGGTSEAELEAAIGRGTAALFLPAHLDGQDGTVPLSDLVRVARRHGVPVLVDAAYLCWPLEIMPTFVAAGADLVCFSAKYFGGPNAGGFIVGSRPMIDAVSTNNFTRYESGPHRVFGRPFKMDRQTVVAVVVAFEEWLAMDHRARWERYAGMVGDLQAAVASKPGVHAEPRYFTMDERLIPEPVNALAVTFEPGRSPNAAAVAELLASGTPSIACVVEPECLIFCVDVMTQAETTILGGRLAAALSAP